ncbi:MAG: urease accessory protein UreF [Terriglobales bacterium]
MTSATNSQREHDPELAHLRLLHLADSALPIGALAHSFGLESLAACGLLTPGGVPEFLRGYVEEAGVMEAVFCREAFRLAGINAFAGDRWVEINQRLSALKPARESRAGSAALGQHFLSAVLGLGEFSLVRDALVAARQAQSVVHHSPAFGLVAGVLGLDEERAVLAYLHQSLASLVSACQRLLPIGQSEATRILWNLKPALIEAAAHSRACSINDVSCFMPLLDWGAMEHPALTTGLFIS